MQALAMRLIVVFITRKLFTLLYFAERRHPCCVPNSVCVPNLSFAHRGLHFLCLLPWEVSGTISKLTVRVMLLLAHREFERLY